MKLIHTLTIAFSVGLFSCSTQDYAKNPTEINLKNAEISDINLSDYVLTHLQDSSTCLCGNVSYATIWGNDIVILSEGNVFSFNLSDGNFEKRYGTIPGEISQFIDADYVFVKVDNLYIYYFAARELYKYTKDGDFISREKVKTNKDGLFPTKLFPVGTSKYIAKNCYIGSEATTPEFSVVNNSLEYTKTFDSLKIKNGYINNDILSSGNSIYYAPNFGNDIYKIDDENISKEFIVNFDGTVIPEDVLAVGGISVLDWINSCKNFSGMISYCHLSNDNLLFSLFLDGSYCIVKYNISTGKSTIRRIINDSSVYTTQLTVTYGDDGIYLFRENRKNLGENLIIIFIPYSNL